MVAQGRGNDRVLLACPTPPNYKVLKCIGCHDRFALTFTSSMSSTDQPPAVRSSIWYDDGNIVLQAERTQWKVYKGVLAQSSSIFRDMLSFPQPPSDDAELVEGCPVVQLSDSAEEVEFVLRAICHRECVTSCSPLTIGTVAVAERHQIRRNRRGFTFARHIRVCPLRHEVRHPKTPRRGTEKDLQ